MNGSIYEEALKILGKRGVEFRSKFVPPLLSSFACHLLNLENRKRHFFYMNDRVPDLRMHVLIVSPPGFGRSFTMKQLMHPDYGILNAGLIPMRFAGFSCLPSGTKVEMENGTRKPIEEISKGDKILSLGKDWMLRPSTVTSTWRNFAPLLKIKLGMGYELTLTPNHPLRTLNSWVEAGDLSIGDQVGVAMKYEEQEYRDIDDRYLAMLGFWIANGNFDDMNFYSVDPVVIREATKILNSFGLNVRKTNHLSGSEHTVTYPRIPGKPRRNPLKDKFREFLDTKDLEKIVRDSKFIPDFIFQLSNEKLAVFLRWLWTDGYADDVKVDLAQKNPAMLRDVRELLKRFGIFSSIYKTHLTINDTEQKRIFMDKIGFVGKHSDQTWNDKQCIGATKDRLSREVWDLVNKKRIEHNFSWNQLDKMTGKGISKMKKSRRKPTHQVISQLGDILKSKELKDLGNSDIAFLEVKEIEELKPDFVYNLSATNPNFVAEGLITHNTEAGLIGSNERQSGQTIKIKGLFELMKDGIIGVEEFFSMTQAMEQQHSAHLEPALNQALLDGDVRKRLRSGPIEYHTDVSLWASTQTTRFQVGGGLLRRFFLINWVPTEQEEALLKKAIWRATNLHLDPIHLKDFRSRIIDFQSNLRKINRLVFTDDLKEELNQLKHFTALLMRRYAIGYNLINYPIEKEFLVDTDMQFSELVKKADRWRKVLIGDPESNLIKSVVERHRGKVKWDKLKWELVDYSMRFDATDNIIRRMLSSRQLYYRDGVLYTPERFREEFNGS